MRIAVPVPGVAQLAIALRGCTYSPSQKRFPCGVSRRRCRWSGRTPPRSEKSLRVVSLSHQRAVHALDNILEAAPGARRFHRGSGSACGATRRHVGKRKRSTAVSPFNPRAKGPWRKVSTQSLQSTQTTSEVGSSRMCPCEGKSRYNPTSCVTSPHIERRLADQKQHYKSQQCTDW